MPAVALSCSDAVLVLKGFSWLRVYHHALMLCQSSGCPWLRVYRYAVAVQACQASACLAIPDVLNPDPLCC